MGHRLQLIVNYSGVPFEIQNFFQQMWVETFSTISVKRSPQFIRIIRFIFNLFEINFLLTSQVYGQTQNEKKMNQPETLDQNCSKVSIEREVKPRRSKYKQPDLEIISRTFRQTTLSGFIKQEPKASIEEIISENSQESESEKRR